MLRKLLFVGVMFALVFDITFFVARRHHPARGEMVHLASDACSCSLGDKIIHLHLSNDGSLTINSDAVQDKKLATLLTEIYATRAERILYVSVDEDVPFQKVVEVIDGTQNLRFPGVVPEPPAMKRFDRISLGVRLLTKTAMEKNCSHGCRNWMKEPILLPPQ